MSPNPPSLQEKEVFFSGRRGQRLLMGLLGSVLLLCLLGSTFASLAVPVAQAQTSVPTLQHTSPTVDPTCKQTYYSRDGNPFQLCPGPFPKGGNCVWWAWEQWHLLGYDLPLNWGNAADWVVDAERVGLPVGNEPRAGSIAVFPRNDGVWAYGDPGHVAFVTSVSADGNSFDVTYQNYGDPTPMYIGHNYNVPYINQDRFQKGLLRFIYFPMQIDQTRFLSLSGVNGNDLQSVLKANSMPGTTSDLAASQIKEKSVTLGLPGGSGSAEQEFNADFTGSGVSELLLYDRQKGSLSILNLTHSAGGFLAHVAQRDDAMLPTDSVNQPNTLLVPQRMSLSDATTPVNGWGKNLDIRIGDFAGTGESDILLYDRTNGKLQLITLTVQLTIKKHVTLAGWGPNWELSTGRFDGQRSGVFMYNRFADASVPVPVGVTDRGGLTLGQWYAWGRTATAVLLDFNPDLSVRHIQQYTKWHNSWEVYIGRFKNSQQDGVFLYDRGIGEMRIMDFASDLQINDYQELHNFSGNWQVFSGDFNGSGRSQVLLYDPSHGNGQFLVFGSDLSLQRQQHYSGWHANDVFYVGHFGTDRLNAMLYDPQAGTSSFIVFNDALKIMHVYTVKSWDQHWQILIGAFVNNALCSGDGSCQKHDDILVLNRKTGEVQQYDFTFGRQYQVIDNRVQSFQRSDAASTKRLLSIDTTTFQSVGSFQTTISGEELY